jgi:hypothetical protein
MDRFHNLTHKSYNHGLRFIIIVRYYEVPLRCKFELRRLKITIKQDYLENVYACHPSFYDAKAFQRYLKQFV